MRTINGHFTVINEPGMASKIAANLLEMFESVRDPQHIIITATQLSQSAKRAHDVMSSSLERSIASIENQLAELDVPGEKVTNAKIDKAQLAVLEATSKAERASSRRNWTKLDKARKALTKQLEKAGFESYTLYADFINSQGIGGAQRRELLVARDELIANKRKSDRTKDSLSTLSPAQVITVLADVLARSPRTPVGPLPIVFDDALRNLDISTKLRALEVLKAHSCHYATWYITDDPVVLGWAGFEKELFVNQDKHISSVYDIDLDVA